MLFNGKSLAEITADDLNALIIDHRAEDYTLEFKQCLPGNKDEDKKEFLNDASSFANASGGFIIYGIAADQGKATALLGCVGDADAEQLRLSNILLACIEPRVRGIKNTIVTLINGNWVLILSIPKSWVGPHAVTFKGSSRVYGRQFSGKYQLKPDEIKEAYASSINLKSKLLAFRPDRLAKIQGGDTPIPLWDAPKIVTHIVPVSSMQNTNVVDIKTVEGSELWQKVGFEGVSSAGINSDGLLKSYIAHMPEYEGSGLAYVQLFRNGIIEIVDALTLQRNRVNKQEMLWFTIEDRVIPLCYRALALQRSIGFQPPVLIMVSMLDVADFSMNTANLPREYRISTAINRHTLLLPEVWLDEYPADAPTFIASLKPPMDALWNATGFPEWITYYACLQRWGSMKL